MAFLRGCHCRSRGEEKRISGLNQDIAPMVAKENVMEIAIAIMSFLIGVLVGEAIGKAERRRG